jgi:hypothetical protein
MPEGNEPHPLAYAAPRVLFERVRHHHTSNHLESLIGLTLGGALVLVFPARTLHDGRRRWIAAGIGCAALLAAMITAYKWFWGEDKIIRITEDGIEEGRRMWSWSNVEFFGGIFRGNDVYITFAGKLNKFLLREYFKQFYPSPVLTVAEYQSLAKEIEREICPKYPRLVIDPGIREDPSS